VTFLLRISWLIESALLAGPLLILGLWMIRVALRMPIKTRAALRAIEMSERRYKIEVARRYVNEKGELETKYEISILEPQGPHKSENLSDPQRPGGR